MRRLFRVRAALLALAGFWAVFSAAGIAAGTRAGWGSTAVALAGAASATGAVGILAAASSTSRPRSIPLDAARRTVAERIREEAARLGVEQKMLQTEKLATVGQLAAGVAHEINNPLGAILLYANLLVETTDAADPRRTNMERIVAQARRAQEIVKGLLDFARQAPHSVARFDVNALVEETLEFLERHPGMQAARVRVEPSAMPLLIDADRAKIQQVLINVIVNAIEAMTDGGDLTLRTGFSERPGMCRIAVTDTGSGIAEEHIPLIFDPFFSTKDVGQGTGLGLAISYGIVQQHGGEIEVQSTAGKGTTIRVLLPCVSEAP